MSAAQQEINLYVCNIFLTTVVMMNTYTRPDEIASSRSSRANRLKRLRKMTNQSRKSFSNLYGISQGTLQNWETARFGGLTEKGAHIILQALQKEGIHCNFEWLMYGAGHGPSFDRLLNKEQEAIKPKKVLVSSIDEDLKTFQRLNHDTIHMYIPDDSMEPYYSEGELVAGITHRKQFDASEQEYIQSHFGIITGLYGLLRPFDKMLPYSLEMKNKLLIDNTLLTHYWHQ